MQKIYHVFLLVALLGLSIALEEISANDSQTQPEFTVDKGPPQVVEKLNDLNFEDFLIEKETLVVLFNVPSFGHYGEIDPEFEKAATKLQLSDPPFQFAYMEVTLNPKTARNFGLYSFPALIMFRDKVPRPITYKFNNVVKENKLVTWVLRAGTIGSTLKDCEGIQKAADIHKQVAVFFGEDAESPEFKAYLEAANDESMVEDFIFMHTFDKECPAKYGTHINSVSLFREFDKKPVHHDGALTREEIVQFVSQNYLPTVIDFNEYYVDDMAFSPRPTLFLFRGANDLEAPLNQVFNEAAEQLKKKALFSVAGAKEGIQNNLMEVVGVRPEMMPLIMIRDSEIFNDTNKYLLHFDRDTLTVDKIRSFIDDYYEGGKLTRFLMSEALPQETGFPIKVIVGQTYEQIVLEGEGDLFVKYYVPWCAHSQLFGPIWLQLAEDLQTVPGLTIAEFDLAHNEVDDLEVWSYPTLLYYPDGLHHEPIQVEAEKDLDFLKEWLAGNSQPYMKWLAKQEL